MYCAVTAVDDLLMLLAVAVGLSQPKTAICEITFPPELFLPWFQNKLQSFLVVHWRDPGW